MNPIHTVDFTILVNLMTKVTLILFFSFPAFIPAFAATTLYIIGKLWRHFVLCIVCAFLVSLSLHIIRHSCVRKMCQLHRSWMMGNQQGRFLLRWFFQSICLVSCSCMSQQTSANHQYQIKPSNHALYKFIACQFLFVWFDTCVDSSMLD